MGVMALYMDTFMRGHRAHCGASTGIRPSITGFRDLGDDVEQNTVELFESGALYPMESETGDPTAADGAAGLETAGSGREKLQMPSSRVGECW